MDVNEVGKVRLTDAVLRRILHVSLDAPTHGRILPTPDLYGHKNYEDANDRAAVSVS